MAGFAQSDGAYPRKDAKTLGVGQDAISRVEKRTDMLLSTLGDYVKGMGGELKLVAEFPAARRSGSRALSLWREARAKPTRTPKAPARRAKRRSPIASAPRKRRKAA